MGSTTLSRRVARSSTATAPNTGSVTVVAGSLRTADDPTALDVKISIWDTEITMRAGGAELGHWSADVVKIRPIDSFSFEFLAEGDRLIFMPNDPDAFREHPMVAGRAGKKRRKDRKKKAKQVEAPPVLRWDETTEAEGQARAKRAAATKAAESGTPIKEKRSKRKSQDVEVEVDEVVSRPRRFGRRRQEAAEAVDTVDSWIDSTPTPAPTIDSSPPIQEDRVQRPAPLAAPPADLAPPAPAPQHVRVPQPAPAPAPTSQQAYTPAEAVTPAPQVAGTSANTRRDIADAADVFTDGEPSSFDELRHRSWMWMIDLAREYDWFGLDRVQVTDEMRERAEHSHTWNHRVAPKSGPGSWICTICGAINRDR